jgi:hypothetical protein
MKILLLGASKTGTTAITYAIHEYLPDHEIIFEPASLQKINYEKPNFIAKYLDVRDWKAITEYSPTFDRKVLIVRHPLDRLISLLLYTPYNTPGFSSDRIALQYLKLLKQKTINPHGHSTLEIIDSLNQLKGGNIVRGFKLQYEGMAKIMSSNLDFFVLKYEDFIDGNLKDLGEYLEISMNPVDVEVPQEYQRVNRTKGYDDWKNWLTLSDLQKLSIDFAEICEILQYDLTLAEDYPQSIDPQKSYLYTQAVVNEFRRKNFLPEVNENHIIIEDEGLLFDQAFAQWKSENLSDAEALMSQGISLNPKIPGFYILLAKIQIQGNQLEAASIAISQALELDPKLEENLPKKFLKIRDKAFN